MDTSLNSQLLVASLVNVMELIKVSQDTFLNMKIASAFRQVYNENANKDNGRCKKTERLIERVIDKVLANNVVYEAKIRSERLRNLSRDKSQPSTSGTVHNSNRGLKRPSEECIENSNKQIKRTPQAPVDVDEIVPEVGTSMNYAPTSMRNRLPPCECGSIHHRAGSTIVAETRPVNGGDNGTDQNAYIVDLSD
ncbi:unnamed protein product [Rotaria magnacalcarata]|uniref:Uncharacterized protein n=1 Tax=Rotaria magnacalcarata TaxID=392030 RepID=A0A820JMW2_9BILA|nr:unnamed protein product [Rotaria magnacalcarata]